MQRSKAHAILQCQPAVPKLFHCKSPLLLYKALSLFSVLKRRVRVSVVFKDFFVVPCFIQFFRFYSYMFIFLIFLSGYSSLWRERVIWMGHFRHVVKKYKQKRRH